MLIIHNVDQFIQALEESHEAGDKTFDQFINFFKQKCDSDVKIYPEIGGSWKFFGWQWLNMNGGLLYDEEAKTWSSHT